MSGGFAREYAIPEQIVLKVLSARRDPQQHWDVVALVTRANFCGREVAPQFRAVLDHYERCG